MQIPMSYKVEDYKESVIMGFPLRQSMHIIAAFIIIAAIIAIMSLCFNISVLIAVYAGIPFAAPVIIAGFPDASGMTKIDVIKKKKEIRAYGKNGKLIYGTGLNEALILELNENKNTEDDFDKTLRRFAVMGIAAVVIFLLIIIAIIAGKI